MYSAALCTTNYTNTMKWMQADIDAKVESLKMQAAEIVPQSDATGPSVTGTAVLRLNVLLAAETA